MDSALLSDLQARCQSQILSFSRRPRRSGPAWIWRKWFLIFSLLVLYFQPSQGLRGSYHLYSQYSPRWCTVYNDLDCTNALTWSNTDHAFPNPSFQKNIVDIRELSFAALGGNGALSFFRTSALDWENICFCSVLFLICLILSRGKQMAAFHFLVLSAQK